MLCQFARRQGLQEADAQDLVQQVMLAVSQKMEGFEYAREQGKFRSWLATIALRTLWKHKTRTRKHALSLLDASQLNEFPARPLGVLEDLDAALIDVATNAIQPEFATDKWDAFLRLWKKDEPPQEVARQFGRSPNWVYKVKHEVLKRLEAEVTRIRDDLPNLNNF